MPPSRWPGLTNAWTMPIKTRIDMLSTGIKTPVGIKVAGPDLAVLERLGKEIEAVVRTLPGTAGAYAERVMGGNYLDVKLDRDAIGRYGLTVGDVQGRDSDRRGRGKHHDHRGGSGALSGQPPVQPRVARRSAGAAIRSGRHAGGRADSARQAGRHRIRPRSAEHQKRRGKAQRLGLCGHQGCGPGRLCRAGARRRGGAGGTAGRVFHGLERPVRIPQARRAAHGAGGARNAFADRRDRLSQPPLAGGNADRAVRRSVRPDGIDLASVPAGTTT